MKTKPSFYLGAAFASNAQGPYRRVQDTPVLSLRGISLAAEDPYAWRCSVTGRLHLLFRAMQTVRTPKPESRLVIPGGWLGYTYTSEGGNLSSWAPPSLAFNRTLTVTAEPWALATASGATSSEAEVEGRKMQRWPWLSRSAADSKPARDKVLAALVGLPAIVTQDDFTLMKAAAQTSFMAASARPAVADANGRLRVERLERPQLLMSADGSHPTHCFVSIMLNGSSANAVLRLSSSVPLSVGRDVGAKRTASRRQQPNHSNAAVDETVPRRKLVLNRRERMKQRSAARNAY